MQQDRILQLFTIRNDIYLNHCFAITVNMYVKKKYTFSNLNMLGETQQRRRNTTGAAKPLNNNTLLLRRATMQQGKQFVIFYTRCLPPVWPCTIFRCLSCFFFFFFDTQNKKQLTISCLALLSVYTFRLLSPSSSEFST